MAETSLPKTKVCTKCGVEKPLSEFHKSKRLAYSVHSRCKRCANAYKRQRMTDPRCKAVQAKGVARWKEANADHWRALKKEQCRRARAREAGFDSYEAYRASKPAKREGQGRIRIDGIRVRKNLKRRCPLLSAYPKIHYQINKEQILERVRAYYRNHTKTARAKVKRWKEANPGRVSQTRYKRRAALAEAENSLTTEQWRSILAAYRYRCAYCGRKGKLTMDHVVPVILGGPHTATNIVPACQRCNSSKGARPAPVHQPHLIC